MARLNTEPTHPEYYPPRARWYSRLLLPWFAVQRTLHLERLRLPSGLSTAQFLLSLVFPGYAFFANGRRVLGWAFVVAYVFSGLLFLIALGYSIGGMAYGAMISVHASSIIFLEGRWLREGARFGLRLVLAMLTLLAVWQAFYSPLAAFVEDHWVMPLRVKGNVVVVQRLNSAEGIKRGDVLMYTINGGGAGDAHRAGGAVRVQAGFGGAPVLALAGDRVEFSTNSFSVNGRTHPLLPHMPTSGELGVPEKHWFIWPELGINQNGNTTEATISAMMLQLATVSEDQFVGKPFKRWFWRRQLLP